MSHRHSDYRDSHFSSETLKAMEQGKRGQASQARSQERLQRKQAARERKLARQAEGNDTEPPVETMGPTGVPNEIFPSSEAPQSPTARLLGFLSRLPGTVMGLLRGVEFYAPGGPEDIQNAFEELKERRCGRGKETLH